MKTGRCPVLADCKVSLTVMFTVNKKAGDEMVVSEVQMVEWRRQVVR